MADQNDIDIIEALNTDGEEQGHSMFDLEAQGQDEDAAISGTSVEANADTDDEDEWYDDVFMMDEEDEWIEEEWD